MFNIKQMRIEMKKTFLAAVLIAVAFGQSAFAQTDSASVFKNVIASYISLKNALTIDNGDSAAVSAGQLFRALGEMPADSLASQHAAWTKYHDKLSREAIQIKNANGIDAQREHFKALSVDIYAMLKSLEINHVDLYYDYCPMAKAYWVSEEGTIVNPYLGQSMPTCGSVKDTLKACR